MYSTGFGDYLCASSLSEVWIQRSRRLQVKPIFFQAGCCEVGSVQAGHTHEQSLVHVFARMASQEFWLFFCGECSLLILFT